MAPFDDALLTTNLFKVVVVVLVELLGKLVVVSLVSPAVTYMFVMEKD
jgi:branched-subunit amino acid transport protein AzlD